MPTLCGHGWAMRARPKHRHDPGPHPRPLLVEVTSALLLGRGELGQVALEHRVVVVAELRGGGVVAGPTTFTECRFVGNYKRARR